MRNNVSEVSRLLASCDDALHAAFAADNKRSQVIVVVVFNSGAWITFCIGVQEAARQVRYELFDVPLLPTVFALKVIDRVFPFVQDIEHCSIICVNFVIVFAHGRYQKSSGECLV